jgi:hypothetical protein
MVLEVLWPAMIHPQKPTSLGASQYQEEQGKVKPEILLHAHDCPLKQLLAHSKKEAIHTIQR